MRTYIAITGKIGSGKSTVAKIVSEMGYPVVSCDEINAKLLKNEDYIEALYDVFPQVFIDGVFNKQALTELVFSDENARNRLNEMSHPLIFWELFQKMRTYDGIVFAEVPILFGTGKEYSFDRIWAVRGEEDTYLDRIVKRDGCEREDAKKRLEAQNVEVAADVNVEWIENDGSVEELKERVKRLLCAIE